MIVVDTSVWVAALRDATSPEARTLTALLDADEVALPLPVRVELLSGASRRDLPRLRRALSSLPVLYPSDETWQLLESWIDRTAAAGEHFGVGDLLIAALASDIGALIWSLDSDFARLEQLRLVHLH